MRQTFLHSIGKSELCASWILEAIYGLKASKYEIWWENQIEFPAYAFWRRTQEEVSYTFSLIQLSRIAINIDCVWSWQKLSRLFAFASTNS